MEVVYLLIPLSVMFLAGAIWALTWAVKTNQFDDLVGPAHRIIIDDNEARREQKERLKDE
ncbi:cbb3-type cytochrome oxidase maturation protein [Fluviicoccus keumensis]|uniref:Cbb3-type cytochrome oxidase maturation protein n=1 Tax=Fluviicoccus keumensis TaxID=1435465 RepID=A0A4Q7Z9K5_9GAMM|nr:cbb3-type cytochrome oxidase assembly protein CcoS [Fluviicoccus keumensis]RZU47200.1 cbb3-type cytochrome oxidase maturation protein [Fluviicoccus keumensis]